MNTIMDYTMKENLKTVIDETTELAEKIYGSNQSVNQLVSDIKSIIMKSAMKKAIPVELCTEVSAKLIVLVSLMK